MPFFVHCGVFFQRKHRDLAALFLWDVFVVPRYLGSLVPLRPLVGQSQAKERPIGLTGCVLNAGRPGIQDDLPLSIPRHFRYRSFSISGCRVVTFA